MIRLAHSSVSTLAGLYELFSQYQAELFTYPSLLPEPETDEAGDVPDDQRYEHEYTRVVEEWEIRVINAAATLGKTVLVDILAGNGHPATPPKLTRGGRLPDNFAQLVEQQFDELLRVEQAAPSAAEDALAIAGIYRQSLVVRTAAWHTQAASTYKYTTEHAATEALETIAGEVAEYAALLESFRQGTFA